ncbi:MAG: mercury(II) reductase [Chloroflexi bacterium]|nr:mercury(II) reductase [Chloroflexota bacterium]
MTEQYDLVILGSGSTAFAAALRAAELGKTAAMVESRQLGGTCVNRGCLPSKNLIEAARIVWETAHPRYPGLRPRQVEFDFAELVGQKDALVHDYREGKYNAILRASDRIRLYQGHGELVADHKVAVDGELVEGDHILIATGTLPILPPIDGIDKVPYLTSDLLAADEEQELHDLPGSIIVVGGGHIALELGQMFHRFGSEVTIVERSWTILSGYEPEVSRAVTEVFRDEGIDLVTGVTVRHVFQDAGDVIALGDDGTAGQRFRARRLLVATGRAPNTDGIGLKMAGVELDRQGFIKVSDELQTSVPHIWAAGDVIGAHTGSQMATPVGAHDGRIAAGNALGGTRRKADHSVIPRTIFVDPQVAVVGLTDEEGKARGHNCWCNTIPVSIVPRAEAIHDTRGIAKMVIDVDTNKVLGVSLVMRNAGEVIHEAAMGIRLGATLDDFIDMVHVYPTMAEALKLVAISRYKDPARLSCCAE